MNNTPQGKRKPARITDVRPVDEGHQVVTITGGGGLYRREPCGGCPWRVDQTGAFPAGAFKESARTAYDRAESVFSCHESGTDKPATCAGFLMRGADHNIAVRVKYATGKMDFHAISDGGLELHDSYRAMAVANGVDPADPVLTPCR
ncbi:MAG: DUF6283 family protein [Telluria sp.]